MKTTLRSTLMVTLLIATTPALAYDMQAQPRPYGGDSNAYENNTGYNKYYNNSDSRLGSGIRNMQLSKECSEYLSMDDFKRNFHYPNGSPCDASDRIPDLGLGNIVNNKTNEYSYTDDPTPYYPKARPGYSQKQIADAKFSAVVAKRILKVISYQNNDGKTSPGLSAAQTRAIADDQYMYSYYYTRCITTKVYNDLTNIRNILNTFKGENLTRRMSGHTAGMARSCYNSSKRNSHRIAHDPLFDDHLSQWDYQ